MSAGITLAKAKKVFQREVGCIDDHEILSDAIMASLEFVMLNGGGDILREWKVIARDGRFAFPRDLETPLKYKFSQLPNADFGTIASPYFSYSSSAIKTCCGYLPWDPSIEIKANKVGAQFEPPCSGVRLVATTRHKHDIGKKILVSGMYRQKEIPGLHNGYKTSGELLTIYGEEDSNKKFSAYTFDRITGVTKDLTNDWIMLSGIDPQDKKAYFLSHYHPDDETIQFVQGELRQGCCGPSNCDVCLYVLGRVNPTIRYTRDEDILPISSLEMLTYMARRQKYSEGGELQEEAAMEQRIKNLIRQQVSYQQAADRTLSFKLSGSGCSLTNL